MLIALQVSMGCSRKYFTYSSKWKLQGEKIVRKFLLASFLVLPVIANAASYKIDSSHTYPNFTVSHLGFSTMYGQFAKTTGTLEMDLGKSGSVNITIDAASIYTGFEKRDKHLRSPDFFNVAEFPDITFKSTKVIFSGKSKAKVTGDLTIMGVTKSITLDVPDIKCGKHPFNPKITEICGFNAHGSVKRSDFGMKFGLPAIGDEITINLEVEATR